MHFYVAGYDVLSGLQHKWRRIRTLVSHLFCRYIGQKAIAVDPNNLDHLS